jgi:hypothetical protein
VAFPNALDTNGCDENILATDTRFPRCLWRFFSLWILGGMAINYLPYAISAVGSLLSKGNRPKVSQTEQDATARLRDSVTRYGNMAGSATQRAEQSTGQYRDIYDSYLRDLDKPVGSDAEDAASLARAGEGISADARRATARVASSVPTGTSIDANQIGDMAGVENQRLSAYARLRGNIAMKNLERKQQRSEKAMNAAARLASLDQNELYRILAQEGAANSQLLNVGQRQTAIDQQAAGQNQAAMNALMEQLGSAASSGGWRL